MSYAPDFRVVCANLQDELVGNFLTCDPERLRGPMPFFDFLWSDFNRSGVQQRIAPGGGKKRTLELIYGQRLLESAVTESDLTTALCTATTKRGNLSTTYTIDPESGVKVEQLFTMSDWIEVCQDNASVFYKEVQKMIDVLVCKVATDLTGAAASLVGNWDSTIFDGTNASTVGSLEYLKVSTKYAGTTQINPEAMEEINHAIMESQFCNNNAVIFSGRTLSKYFNTMKAGCCSTDGINVGEMLAMYGKAILFDRRVQAASDPDEAWVVAPGALQPIYYTANNDGTAAALASIGVPAFAGANYYKTVVQDPQSGMPMDLTVSDDCGNISVILRGAYDVIGMPADMFAPGDTMEGVTFMAGIDVVNT